MRRGTITVLTIREHEIAASQYDRQGNELETATVKLDGQDLAPAFTQIKSDLDPARLRVLLPEEKSYLFALNVDFNAEDIDNQITQRLNELTHEPPENLVYDHQVIGKNASGLVVQVIATDRPYLHQLEEAASHAELEIEMTEPVSFALARESIGIEKPQLIVYYDDKVHLVIAHQGRVFASLPTHSVKFLVHQTEDLIQYAATNFGLKVSTLVTNTSKPEIVHLTEAHGLDLARQELNPSLSLALKGHTLDEDEIITVSVENAKQKTKHTSAAHSAKRRGFYPPTRQSRTKPSRAPQVFAILLVFGIIFAGGVLLYDTFRPAEPASPPEVLGNQDTIADANNPIVPTVEPSPTPTPTPTPVPSRKDLKVKVLNGNGAVGGAAKGKEFLTNLGYTVTGVGNADRYDYTTTEIQLKESKAHYYDLMVQDLSASYRPSKGAVLAENDPNDAVVIMGEK